MGIWGKTDGKKCAKSSFAECYTFVREILAIFIDQIEIGIWSAWILVAEKIYTNNS